MADLKISALTALAGASVDSTADVLPIVDTSAVTTKKITAAELAIALGLPAGMVVPYAGSSTPTGWLLCYGQAVSRSTYSALFTAISTVFGVGDGVTTFNLPDLRGRLPFGKDNMGGVAASRLTSAGNGTLDGATLSATGGNQLLSAHTHTGPSHTHTGPSHTHTGTTGTESATHTHTGPSHTHTGTTGTVSADHTHSGTTSSDGSHTHTIPTASSGTPSITPNSVQGYVDAPDGSGATGSGGTHNHTFTTGGISANHTHSFTSDAAGTGATGTESANHTHSFTTDAGGTGATGAGGTGATGSTGSGDSQNVPPGIVLNYIIKT